MVYFNSDYMTGAHPAVLKKIIETNGLHTPGYGCDTFTTEAKRKIIECCGLDRGEVFFLTGGTQTNTIVIDRLLSLNDGVLATDTSHINVHEAGAIEACGHKVLSLPNHDGKLTAYQVDEYITNFYKDDTYLHMVAPGMVYISYPTELGTLYTRNELQKLYDVCRKWNIPLYIDGARLAYGLAATDAELTLRDISKMCDVFYIGGTKCGALFGEAVVTHRPELLPRFFSIIKLHGALLAKGRLLGIQFATLFTDDLYQQIGDHAVKMAMILKNGFINKGYRLYIDSPTNQQFFVLPNAKIEELRKKVSFDLWGPLEKNETPVRFVTDWSTTEKDVLTLIDAL